MKTKEKLTAVVQKIIVKSEEMDVCLSGTLYTCTIRYTDVNWHPINIGNSTIGSIGVGTKIEFDNDIHPAVRELHNVNIII